MLDYFDTDGKRSKNIFQFNADCFQMVLYPFNLPSFTECSGPQKHLLWKPTVGNKDDSQYEDNKVFFSFLLPSQVNNHSVL